MYTSYEADVGHQGGWGEAQDSQHQPEGQQHQPEQAAFTIWSQGLLGTL
jgi:hypothetical protein